MYDFSNSLCCDLNARKSAIDPGSVSTTLSLDWLPSQGFHTRFRGKMIGDDALKTRFRNRHLRAFPDRFQMSGAGFRKQPAVPFEAGMSDNTPEMSWDCLPLGKTSQKASPCRPIISSMNPLPAIPRPIVAPIPAITSRFLRV